MPRIRTASSIWCRPCWVSEVPVDRRSVLMSLIESSATELLAQLNSGEITSVEVTQAYLAEIERWDPQVKAFLRSDGEAALAQAADVDRRRRRASRSAGWAGCRWPSRICSVPRAS